MCRCRLPACRVNSFLTRPCRLGVPCSTIKAVSDKIPAVAGAGLDLVVAWADPVDVTAKFVTAQGISPELAFGAGLKEADMRALGLYVSKPRGYWTQEYNFAEPAYFVLKPVRLP